jgi:hypothetical protein
MNIFQTASKKILKLRTRDRGTENPAVNFDHNSIIIFDVKEYFG